MLASLSTLEYAQWTTALVVAICAGIFDWRSRKIPNWLTVSGAAAGIAVNTIVNHGAGLRAAVLGMLLGLALLLPFVLIKSLGAGDWKMAGALGACLGSRFLLATLMGAILVAGVMALALVIAKGRVRQTALNAVRMLAALFSLRMPGAEVSLDNPESAKIPFGVALALAVIVCAIGVAMGKVH